MAKRYYDMGKNFPKEPLTKYSGPPSMVIIHVVSKTGVEIYSLPEDFSGVITVGFNMGGCSSVERKDKLK